MSGGLSMAVDGIRRGVVSRFEVLRQGNQDNTLHGKDLSPHDLDHTR